MGGAPDHGAVDGAGRAGQHRGMQRDTSQSCAPAPAGRSPMGRLPPAPAGGAIRLPNGRRTDRYEPVCAASGPLWYRWSGPLGPDSIRRPI